MHLFYNFLIDIVIMFSSISGLFICWLICFDQIYKMMNTYLKKMSTLWWSWKLVQPYENCKKILGSKTGCLLTFCLHNLSHLYYIFFSWCSCWLHVIILWFFGNILFYLPFLSGLYCSVWLLSHILNFNNWPMFSKFAFAQCYADLSFFPSGSWFKFWC